MSSLLHNLGIDWKLLLSQAVNFAILLIVLRLLVYRPLVELMNKRKKRISEGLEKADEADRRLEEIGLVQKEKLKESQQRALELLREAEKDAKEQEKKILATAALREQEIIKRAQEKAVEQEKEAYAKAQSQTVELVKQILIKTVQIAPTAVDETLIQKVATENQKLS